MPATEENKIIIAIDGYSSCGKSTVAKKIAQELNYIFIDSGAMYRAVTYFCLQQGLVSGGVVKMPELLAELENITINFAYNERTAHNDIWLNGVNIETEIRQLDVAQNVSQIAAIAEVRHLLVAQQQKMGALKGIVMDGRDIGTVVFPQAELKVFMQADPHIRARRRYDEMVEKKETVNFDEILANINARDRYDETRDESPLRRAEDAIVLDNSFMTRDEQFKWILAKAKERMKR
jgi:cytidylate kinase